MQFDTRMVEQTWSYDYLGNTVASTDDQSGFYDRSLGTISNGAATSGPHRIVTASNRTTPTPGVREGELSVLYDGAGNLIDLAVQRDGPCLPTTMDCWQRFRYRWDELGRLVRAVRWDLASAERAQHSSAGSPGPESTPDVELLYSYDSGGTRVRKTAVAGGAVSHTVYVSPTLELRRAKFEGPTGSEDYTMDVATTHIRLGGGGVTARVVQVGAVPDGTDTTRLLMTLADYLGSSTLSLDHTTGELVESGAYGAYGATDASYRPARWGAEREPYRFTGKEEDVEVGLAYFGARYLSLGLGCWMSPDPVAVHEVRGDLNPYAYVAGRPTVAVDPDGREIATAIVVGAAISFAIAYATESVA